MYWHSEHRILLIDQQFLAWYTYTFADSNLDYGGALMSLVLSEVLSVTIVNMLIRNFIIRSCILKTWIARVALRGIGDGLSPCGFFTLLALANIDGSLPLGNRPSLRLKLRSEAKLPARLGVTRMMEMTACEELDAKVGSEFQMNRSEYVTGTDM
ncbi:hypothetical protein EDB92DRAFT_1813143 [Lactarius akahatsu]|uniref:Uncharacterized protein n=1 Tax=Lactarius akahatsu TaxID=416441 RepID=A0AAD4LT13_9AGAM|nr:hypothetical protein EDB92DRAFT_1813143 [Lactarius akahatsu]